MPYIDKSISGSKLNLEKSYLDDLAIAICLNGESLDKYKKIVQKKFGNDVYFNIKQFFTTLQEQVDNRQFTKTSLLNLKHLGQNAGISGDVIDTLIHYFDDKIREEQLKNEEDEYWNKCSLQDKAALNRYLSKFPNGKYTKEANEKITIITQEENAKREENSFWERRSPSNKHQLKEYLKKYPKGKYAHQAKSLILDMERIENEAIEENRMFNQCMTKQDYTDFLRKYPNGAYSAKAKSIIEDIDRKELEEEDRTYRHSKDKKGYLDYLQKYPNGRYVKEVQAKIQYLDKKEKKIKEEDAFWEQCNPNNKHQLKEYLKKYPIGKYAHQAKSLISTLDKKEEDAIEQSRIYNQCISSDDYMDYLRRYPNGLYKNQAQSKINEFEASAREKEAYIREQNIYAQCKTMDDYSDYLSQYPNGMFVSQARKKIEQISKGNDVIGNNNPTQPMANNSNIGHENTPEDDDNSNLKIVPLYFTGLNTLLLLGAINYWICSANILSWIVVFIGAILAYWGQLSQIGAHKLDSKEMMRFYAGGILMTIGGLSIESVWLIGIFTLINALITHFIYRK